MTELHRSTTPSARADGPTSGPRLVEPLPTPLRSLAEGLLHAAYALAVGGAVSLLGGLVVGGVAQDATRPGEVAAASITVSLGVVAAAVVLLALAHAASTLLLGVHLSRVAATSPEAVPPAELRDRVRQDDPVRPLAALCWSLLALAAVAALVVAPALLSDDATSAAGARLLVVATATIAVVGVLLAVLVRRGRRAWSRLVVSLDRVWTPAVVRAATRNERRERPTVQARPDGAPPVGPHGRPVLRILGLGAVGLAAVAGPTALGAVRTGDAAGADAGIVVATACVLLVLGGAVALVAEAPTSARRQAALGRAASAQARPRRRRRSPGR